MVRKHVTLPQGNGLLARLRLRGRRGPPSAIAVVAALALAVAQAQPVGPAAGSYTVTTLQLPPELVGGAMPFMQVWGLNNLGHVVGQATRSSVEPWGPAVWVNGVGTMLPIPAGRQWSTISRALAINDAGDVLGRLDENVVINNQTLRVGRTYLWKNQVPVELHPPRFTCSGAPYGAGPANAPMDGKTLNRAGHVFGFSEYRGGCREYWLYDGAAFRAVTIPCAGLFQAIGGLSSALNDADQIAVGSGAPSFPLPNACTGNSTTVVINPNGSSQWAPAGFGQPLSGNTRGQWLGFTDNQANSHVNLWDPQTGITDLGANTGYAHFNNAGQIAFSGYFPTQTRIWDKGAVTALTYPANNPPIAPGSVVTLINDAGQLAGQNFTINGFNGIVLTPTGNGCASDAGGSVTVARGGFRYDRSSQHFTQIITVTNKSANALAGPFSVALDGVPQSASLFGVAGATLCSHPQGSPYLDNPAASLAPGASVTFTLEFINTAAAGISYSARVLAGPGSR